MSATFSALLDQHGRPYANGRLAPPGSLDEALTATLRDYKLRVAKRYRTLPPSLAPVVLPEGTLWVSPKIDGELWFGEFTPYPSGGSPFASQAVDRAVGQLWRLPSSATQRPSRSSPSNG